MTDDELGDKLFDLADLVEESHPMMHDTLIVLGTLVSAFDTPALMPLHQTLVMYAEAMKDVIQADLEEDGE